MWEDVRLNFFAACVSNAAGRCCAMQLQEQLRSDQGRLSVEQSRCESWQAQLSQQQATIEQLEAAAEEALGEAREAAAAAMAERDKVCCQQADA